MTKGGTKGHCFYVIPSSAWTAQKHGRRLTCRNMKRAQFFRFYTKKVSFCQSRSLTNSLQNKTHAKQLPALTLQRKVRRERASLAHGASPYLASQNHPRIFDRESTNIEAAHSSIRGPQFVDGHPLRPADTSQKGEGNRRKKRMFSPKATKPLLRPLFPMGEGLGVRG
jgi:hypothetical protein